MEKCLLAIKLCNNEGWKFSGAETVFNLDKLPLPPTQQMATLLTLSGLAFVCDSPPLVHASS